MLPNPILENDDYDDIIPLVVQECPFCGCFPKIDCETCRHPSINGIYKLTFTWCLYCSNPDCPVLLKTRHVSLRKKSIYDIESVRTKFLTLESRWNVKNHSFKKALLPISWKDYLRVVKRRIEDDQHRSTP